MNFYILFIGIFTHFFSFIETTTVNNNSISKDTDQYHCSQPLNTGITCEKTPALISCCTAGTHLVTAYLNREELFNVYVMLSSDIDLNVNYRIGLGKEMIGSSIKAVNNEGKGKIYVYSSPYDHHRLRKDYGSIPAGIMYATKKSARNYNYADRYLFTNKLICIRDTMKHHEFLWPLLSVSK